MLVFKNGWKYIWFFFKISENVTIVFSELCVVFGKSAPSSDSSNDLQVNRHLRLPHYGEGNSSPLWYTCLENPMDRRAWRAAVHGVTQSRTDWETNTHSHINLRNYQSCSKSEKKNWTHFNLKKITWPSNTYTTKSSLLLWLSFFQHKENIHTVNTVFEQWAHEWFPFLFSILSMHHLSFLNIFTLKCYNQLEK